LRTAGPSRPLAHAKKEPASGSGCRWWKKTPHLNWPRCKLATSRSWKNSHSLYFMNSLRIAIHKLTLYQGAASKLRKNRNCAGFVSGHDFTGCGKTRRSCLNGPLCIRARLYRLRKNSQNVFQEGALYQGTTLQAAEKLVDRVSMGRFVSGHDFSRAVNATKQRRALAPEGCLPLTSPENRSFSAACLVVPKKALKARGFNP